MPQVDSKTKAAPERGQKARVAAEPSLDEQIQQAAESAARAAQLSAAPDALRPAHVLQLQRQVGNRAVSRLLGGSHTSDVQREGEEQEEEEGQELQAKPDGERLVQRVDDPEQLARQAFIGRGLMPDANGREVSPSTGLGGFNARYDPGSMELTITLRVGLNFVDGLRFDDGTNQVIPVHPDYQTDAANIITTHFPPTAPATDANLQALKNDITTNWHWVQGQKDTWVQGYHDSAAPLWSGRHYFQSMRWSDVYSNVRVLLDIHEGHRANDHCKGTVHKVPANRPGGRAEVNSPSGPGASFGGTFTSQAVPGQMSILSFTAQFPTNSTSVASATINGQPAAGQLDTMIATFQRGTPTGGVPIEITGHASSTGLQSWNQHVSLQRARNIGAYLRTHGDKIADYRITEQGVGADGAGPGPEWCKADIKVGSGEGQKTMAHETGHMLGLGDEYVVQGFIGGGTGGVTGQPADHDAIAKAMGGGVQGAVYENNDNIMSLGNAVRPQHYSTFMEAMNLIAAPEQFQYGGEGAAPRLAPDLIPPRGLPQPEPDTAVV